MGRGVNIPWIGGQNTMGKGVDIPWVGGVDIPSVGGQNFPKKIKVQKFQKISKFQN